MAGDDVFIALRRASFGEKEREAVRFGALSAHTFRYDTGVEAVRLVSPRGSVVALPYLGQMVWSAAFDGVELAMQSMFAAPRPAKTIVETYGCLAYHSGILRNGVPAAADSHPVHGEAPCADMDEAGIACGTDASGRWIAVTGEREYAMGFGAHYRARPRLILREEGASCEIVMEVENLSAAPMDLMYMCHVNFAFAKGARIVQSVPFTPEHVVARTAIPAHVTPTEDYRALIAELAINPARMERLDEPERYDPEQVFYIKGAKPGLDGLVRYLMLRREGDAFSIAWDPEAMPHTIRWVMANSDQRVAAFAMPATCEPEGYTAEKRKGNVRALAGGASARFSTLVGYVDRSRAAAAAQSIEGTRK
ncbi:MAG TPA: DUF4432 family protein [Roseiarcus sp.]|jgi:hypothetical protein